MFYLFQIKLFFLLIHIVYSTKFERILVFTSSGEVGADNCTYYYLNEPGNYELSVVTHEGDADIYASPTKSLLRQNDDITHYELQSTTYGEDVLSISRHLSRPIKIAIFGHSYYPLSKYTFDIYFIKIFDDNTLLMDAVPEGDVIDDFNDNQKFQDSHLDTQNRDYLGQDEEESVLWKLLLFLLKIIFEVLA